MGQEERQHLQINVTSLRKCPRCDTVFSAIAYCPNDGTKLEEHIAETPVQSLFADKYQILDEIGSGGMGTVYRVKQVLLDKILALKVIPSHFLNEQLTARFQREAKTMVALDHPNLARIIDFGIWLNQPFMVMEYVDGVPLSKLISERVVAPAQAVDLFSQILLGLQHAHDRGVLHRDIKPSNIIVRRDNEQSKATLLDFGIAKKLEGDDSVMTTKGLTRTGEMIGSPLYMSPEQARGEKLSEQSDLYSLGCSLFESLTGTPPFVGKTAVETLFLHLDQIAPSLKEAALGRDFSPALEKFMRKALTKNPEDRFASADEMRMALSLCLQQPEQATTDPEPSKKKFPIKSALIPGFLLLVFSIAATSIALLNPSTSEKQQKVVASGTIINNLPMQVPEEFMDADESIAEIPTDADRVNQGTELILTFRERRIANEVQSLIVNDKHLKKLVLVQCKFDKDLLGKLPPSLEFLELSTAELVSADFHMLSRNTNIKTLLLRDNVVSGKDLRALSPLKNLESLDLSNTHIDGEGLRELHAFKKLKHLTLTGNDSIDDHAMQILVSMPQLVWLDISNTKVTAKGIEALSRLPNLTKLNAKALQLENKHMSALKNFKQLRTVRLNNNLITAEAIGIMPALETIHELDLTDNKLNDDVVPFILRFKNLTTLHISRTLISRNGFLKLAKLPKLKAMHAKKNGLSEVDAREFLTRCPSCEAVYYTRYDRDRFERGDL
jgi:serine/threonine protein kinase/uncharacterized C2H2 Zn-finger protein